MQDDAKAFAEDKTAIGEDRCLGATIPLPSGYVVDDKFQILGVLGEGGMSVVYKAKHMLMDRQIALKVVSKHLLTKEGALQRFMREAVAVSSLKQENIIEVFAIGTFEDQPYLAMELLDGQSLAQMLKTETRIPIERAMPIFVQICNALKHAHEHGIVHRDIKPSNVMLVGTEESVKLVDFGIAKILPESGKEQQKLTQTGAIFGSPFYMSPEQCRGLATDARSDIYAMGCLIYEVLAGQPPLAGDTFLETMSNHLSKEPAEINFLSADLNKLIRKAMAKDPDMRFQTISDLKEALISADLTAKNTKLKNSLVEASGRRITFGIVAAALIAAACYTFYVKSSPTDSPAVQPSSFGPPTSLLIRDAQHSTDPRKVEESLLKASKLARERKERQYEMGSLASLVLFYSDKLESFKGKGWFFESKHGRKDEEALRKQLLEAKKLLCSYPNLPQRGTPHTIGTSVAIAACAENSRCRNDEEFFWKHAYNSLVRDERNRQYPKLFQEHLDRISSSYIECLSRIGKSKASTEVRMSAKALAPTEVAKANLFPTSLVLQEAMKMHQSDAGQTEEKLLKVCRLAEDREEPQYRMEAIGALAVIYNDKAWWLDKPVGKRNKDAMTQQLAEARQLLTESPQLNQRYGRPNMVGIVEYIRHCADLSDTVDEKKFFLRHAYDILVADQRNRGLARFQKVLVGIGSSYRKVLQREGNLKKALEVAKEVDLLKKQSD